MCVHLKGQAPCGPGLSQQDGLLRLFRAILAKGCGALHPSWTDQPGSANRELGLLLAILQAHRMQSPSPPALSSSGLHQALCDTGRASAHLWALVSPLVSRQVTGGFQTVCDKPLKGPENPPRWRHPHWVLLTLLGSEMPSPFPRTSGVSDGTETYSTERLKVNQKRKDQGLQKTWSASWGLTVGAAGSGEEAPSLLGYSICSGLPSLCLTKRARCVAPWPWA